jgi:hypothetical protein
MKKLLLSAIFALLVSFGVDASASALTNSVQAAINSGNLDQIAAIAAANPTAQGEIAMFLLQQASAKIGSNPTLAASLLKAAGPMTAQIPASQSAAAAAIIASIVQTASGSGFQTANPDAASGIFSAALVISSQPNIAAAAPGLKATTLASANAFIEKNPQAASNLKETVLLAQTPSVAPTVNTRGANIPSAE